MEEIRDSELLDYNECRTLFISLHPYLQESIERIELEEIGALDPSGAFHTLKLLSKVGIVTFICYVGLMSFKK